MLKPMSVAMGFIFAIHADKLDRDLEDYNSPLYKQYKEEIGYLVDIINKVPEKLEGAIKININIFKVAVPRFVFELF